MALIEEELQIINVENLMSLNLKIPDYQRPYRWSANSTHTLFTDIYEAFKDGHTEYRLGSVILHRENDLAKYNLVDGQQRTTTLSILLYVLGDNSQALLNENYKEPSWNSIQENYIVLQKRIKEMPEEERENYKQYIKKNCTVVKIVTNSEQEAFQFFDSQNSRGKSLKPHDLLKSYHLREMIRESEQEKIALISQWENTNQNDLEILFRVYLYPVIRWFKNRNGLNYSSDKIDYFKGIKSSNVYNYAIYHKASHIFIEQYTSNGSNELLNSNEMNQFQLTQPIIAGNRFFTWTLHYADLLGQVKDKIDRFHKQNKVELPNRGTGDIYIKQLYEASLLFFVDRFGFGAVDDTVMYQLYTWCYSLRIKMRAVYPQTINKYARGQHKRINTGKDVFNLLSEMTNPQELKVLVWDSINAADIQKDRYKEVYKLMKERNGW